MRTAQRGQTILEVLVSLLVAAPLLAASVQLFGKLTRLHWQHRLASDQFFNEYKTRGIFRRAMIDLDSHRFELLPRVFPRGRIVYSDGKPHQITVAHGRFQIDGESSALSSIELDPEHTLSLIESLGTLQARFCPRFGISNSPRYTMFIGLHAHELGYFEVSLRSSAGGLCEVLLLRSVSGLQPLTLNSLPEFLVPISREYVLYRTKTGQLRYLGHEGTKVIENSLLAAQIPPIYSSLVPGVEAGLHTLSLTYGANHRTFYFPSVLKREPIESFILQVK